MRIKERVPAIGLGGTGRLTTEHPASSYGLPVAVFGGVAYGPAEVGPLVALDDDPDMLARGRAAGYIITALDAQSSRARSRPA